MSKRTAWILAFLGAACLLVIESVIRQDPLQARPALHLILSVLFLAGAALPTLLVRGGSSARTRAAPRAARPLLALLLLVLFASAVQQYTAAIVGSPYDVERGDMLASVQLALRKFWLGEGMFGVVWVPWALPLAYFPALNLSFAPAFVAGLDIRWMGCLFYIGVGLALLAAHGRLARSWPTWVAAIGVALFLTQSLAVRSFFPIAHTPFYWLATFLFLLSAASRSYGAASLLLVALLLTRETTVLVAGSYLIHLLHARGARHAAFHAIGIAALTLVAWLPFFDLEGVASLVSNKAQLPGDVWHSERRLWILNSLGFNSVFFRFGIDAWLKPLAAALVIAVWIWQYRAERRGLRGAFFYASGLALVAFYFLSGMPWLYLYYPLCFYWLFGVASFDDAPAAASSAGERSPAAGLRRSGVTLAIGASVLLTSVWLVVSPLIDPTRIDIARSDPVRAGGFHAVESAESFGALDGDYVWGDAGPQRIVVPLHNLPLSPALYLPIEVRVRPFGPSDPHPQRLSLSVSGQLVSSVPLADDWQWVRYHVPAALLRHGANLFSFQPDRALSPGEFDSATDERPLSVAYDVLVIGLPRRLDEDPPGR